MSVFKLTTIIYVHLYVSNETTNCGELFIGFVDRFPLISFSWIFSGSPIYSAFTKSIQNHLILTSLNKFLLKLGSNSLFCIYTEQTWFRSYQDLSRLIYQDYCGIYVALQGWSLTHWVLDHIKMWSGTITLD